MKLFTQLAQAFFFHSHQAFHPKRIKQIFSFTSSFSPEAWSILYLVSCLIPFMLHKPSTKFYAAKTSGVCLALCYHNSSESIKRVAPPTSLSLPVPGRRPWTTTKHKLKPVRIVHRRNQKTLRILRVLIFSIRKSGILARLQSFATPYPPSHTLCSISD